MEQKKITFDSFVRGMLTAIAIVGLIMLLNRLSGVLLPFFLAWLAAYILFPLVKFYQYRCRLKFRIAGILCAFLTVGTILTGLFMLMIPPMIDEFVRVVDLTITYVSRDAFTSNIPNMIEKFIHDNIRAEDVKAFITQEGFISFVKQTIPKVWDIISQSVNILSSMFTLTMVILYTLFILLDYEQFSNGWVLMLPERYRKFAVQLICDIEQGMNKYFRGQGLVAFCVGVLFSIGFLIIDFPMAIGLGMFIGLLNMVPYLQLVGFIPTVLLAVVKAADTGESFWVIMLSALIVFAVVQVIQDTILTPRIMGKVMGLNSAIILLSLSIWGALLGILGMIIALPLTTLLITYYHKYVIKNKQE
ncbi:MAG: AI-2E family transporter [Prevotella sp.]|nr:AI-2E family transporter [Prevotella sp.]